MASHNLALAPLSRPDISTAPTVVARHRPVLRLVAQNGEPLVDGTVRNPALGAAICLGFSGSFWAAVLLLVI